jgi:hypothetical protein
VKPLKHSQQFLVTSQNGSMDIGQLHIKIQNLFKDQCSWIQLPAVFECSFFEVIL